MTRLFELVQVPVPFAVRDHAIRHRILHRAIERTTGGSGRREVLEVERHRMGFHVFEAGAHEQVLQGPSHARVPELRQPVGADAVEEIGVAGPDDVRSVVGFGDDDAATWAKDPRDLVEDRSRRRHVEQHGAHPHGVELRRAQADGRGIGADDLAHTCGLRGHGDGAIDSHREAVRDRVREVGEICTGPAPEVENPIPTASVEKLRLASRCPLPLVGHPIDERVGLVGAVDVVEGAHLYVHHV